MKGFPAPYERMPYNPSMSCDYKIPTHHPTIPQCEFVVCLRIQARVWFLLGVRFPGVWAGGLAWIMGCCWFFGRDWIFGRGWAVFLVCGLGAGWGLKTGRGWKAGWVLKMGLIVVQIGVIVAAPAVLGCGNRGSSPDSIITSHTLNVMLNVLESECESYFAPGMSPL